MIKKGRVIALGFFDGMHIGHSALLKKVTEVSHKTGLMPSVLTFNTHPMGFINGKALPLINSYDDRIGLIYRAFGIGDVIMLQFDKKMAEMPWDAFIDRLLDDHGARCLIAGFDFRFGHGGAGSPGLLEKKCAELKIGCEIIPEVTYDGITVSSSLIRDLLTTGDLDQANKLLGHPHVLTGVVRSGSQLGRTMGIPTINMRFGDGVIAPSFGVYATRVYLIPEPVYTAGGIRTGGDVKAGGDDKNRINRSGDDCLQYNNGAGEDCYYGVTNIGVRPTVGNSTYITAETHIFDYCGDLYGKTTRIEFYKHLRAEVRFNGLGELKAQMQQDCDNARLVFKESGDRERLFNDYYDVMGC